MLHLRSNAAIAIRNARDNNLPVLSSPLAKHGHDCFKKIEKKRQRNDAGLGDYSLDICSVTVGACVHRSLTSDVEIGRPRCTAMRMSMGEWNSVLPCKARLPLIKRWKRALN